MRNLLFKSLLPAIIIAGAISLLNGCSNKMPVTYHGPKITVPLNEKVSYQNDSIDIEDLILSPLDNNCIWTFNKDGYSYELNLKENRWERLDSRFGKYACLLKKKNVAVDEFESDLVWISSESQGLAVYRISNRQLTEFPDIINVSVICFLENDIFVGTANGMFRINRNTFAPFEIRQLAELPVQSIIPLENNTLQINGSYKYNYRKDLLTGSYRSQILTECRKVNELMLCLSAQQMLYILHGNDTLNSTTYRSKRLDNIIADENFIWIPDDLKTGIIRYSLANNSFEIVRIGYDYRDFNVSADDSLIWFLNREGLMVFNKNDLNTSRIFLEDTSSYNGLYADSAYLILCTDKSINVLRKDNLLSHSKNVKQLVLEETPFFSEVSEMISTFKGDFRTSYDKYNEIYLKYSANNNIRVQQKLKELRESLITLLPNSFYTSKDLEKYLTDTIKDEYLTAHFYLHMVRQAIYEGKLKDALEYDSLLSAYFPEYMTSEYTTQIGEVKRAYEVLAMINKSGAPEDEKLWETGSMFYKLHMIAGPRGKYGINMTYPFSFLKKLKNKYPQSPYADNAEFMMIRHVEKEILSSGDEKMIQKVISEYHALLEKYPDSDIRPDMLHCLAWLYYNVGTKENDKRRNLETAADCISTIIKEYPEYTSHHTFDGLDKQIYNALEKAKWDIKLILDKRTYNLNEPVVITFELINTDTKAKSVSVPQSNLPGFILTIERYDLFSDHYNAPAEFEPDFHAYNKFTKDTLIEPDRKYSEKWNILETARISLMLPPGRFVLNQEGRYKITAKPADPAFDTYLQSNIIWITVRNTSKDKSMSKKVLP